MSDGLSFDESLLCVRSLLVEHDNEWTRQACEQVYDVSPDCHPALVSDFCLMHEWYAIVDRIVALAREFAGTDGSRESLLRLLTDGPWSPVWLHAPSGVELSTLEFASVVAG